MKTIILLLGFICMAYAINLTKVQRRLSEELKTKNIVDVKIFMKETLNFETHQHGNVLLKSESTSDAKAQYIMDTLIAIQKRSQKSIQQELKAQHIEFESYWIDNSIIIRNAQKSIIFNVADRKDILTVELEEDIQVDPIEQTTVDSQVMPSPDNIERNIRHVNAPEVWAKGHTGEGIVVGVVDTGVEHDHPALVKGYRGTLGNGRYSHDYNWLGSTSTPTDRNSHGTHCTGTIAGGVARQIGVAPGAKHIHCHGIAGGVGATRCLQWMLAPTRVNGGGADVSRRPHITSHSWGGGGSYCRAFGALINAGVHVIIAAGNSGPRCSSVLRSSDCPDMVSVAALAVNSDGIARFSSRGPGPTRGRQNPLLSAPGSSVLSSIPGKRYGSKSGTSMATPNVAGGVALLWGAVRGLRGNIRLTNQIMVNTALGQTSNLCSSSGSPNNVFGYGTVNWQKALDAAQKYFKTNKLDDKEDWDKFIDSL